jgi:hypothetical protein
VRKLTVTVTGRFGSAKLARNCIMIDCDGVMIQPCGQSLLSIEQSDRSGVLKSGATAYSGPPTTSICAQIPLCSA